MEIWNPWLAMERAKQQIRDMLEHTSPAYMSRPIWKPALEIHTIEEWNIYFTTYQIPRWAIPLTHPCDECGKQFPQLLKIARESQPTVNLLLCGECLLKALMLLEES